jgi:type VI secretion system protein ImpL
MAAALATVKASAAGAPPQLQSFVTSAAGGGAAAQIGAASGAVADAYARVVLPACKEVAQEHYPFFAGDAPDAPMAETLRVFGMGGVIDQFVQARLQSMIDTEGPVWRWREGDPVAGALNASSPEAFAQTVELRDLLAGGLPIKVQVAAFGQGVATVELSSGGTRYRFTAGNNQPRPLLWSANGGLPEASIVLYGAGGVDAKSGGDGPPGPEIDRIEAEGPWALFRLMDKADKRNAGERMIRAEFGEGAARTTLAIALPTKRNPFSRAGIWSFRCPASL